MTARPTRDEIKGVILRGAAFCGVSSANTACTVPQRTLADRDAQTEKEQQQ